MTYSPRSTFVAELSLSTGEVRQAFELAADWFLGVLRRVPDDAWDRPGLGAWTVKELVAHAARSFTTVEQYLAVAPAAPVAVEVAGPVSYIRAAMALPGIDAAVADRGRREAATLGDDVVGRIGAQAERVRALVDATADDAVCGSAVGGIAFGDFLVSRVLELTVHTTDLCDALGFDEQPPEPAATVALALLAGLASTRPDRASVLRALTGRVDLPPGTTLLVSSSSKRGPGRIVAPWRRRRAYPAGCACCGGAGFAGECNCVRRLRRCRARHGRS